MKFLKTHTGAMVVLAVVIVLSVLLGSHRSLVQAREKVEAQFAPIAGDLQDCLDITANLLTVAGRYLDEGELGELTDSRAALAESGGITEAHAAYERLLGDAETVFLKLEDCVLSGRDADYVKGFRTDLAAEQDTIARDGRVRVYPYGAITRGEKGAELADMPAMEPFVCGFSDDGKGVQSADQMRDAMELAKQLDKPITAHCEDESLLTPGWCIHDGEWAKRNGFPGNAPESEWKQVERDLELVRETGCRYHVCHVSTKESVALIRKAKAEGLPVSCETGPHYLILCDEDLMDDGRFKMNPPIRSAADRDALIEGLLDGTIDCIATDHAPHSAEEKSRGLRSLNGIVGLECAFPVLYTELVEPGIVPFATLLNALCVNPRRLFRLPGGKIEAGEIADLTVLDLNRPHAINSGAFFSRGRSTPFDGWTVTAGVDKTICNGNLVYTASSRNINKTPIPPCQEDYL